MYIRKSKENILFAAIFYACEYLHPHKYENIKHFVIDNLPIKKLHGRWEIKFDNLLSDLVEKGIILKTKTGWYLLPSDIKPLMIKLDRFVSINKKSYFSAKEEQPVKVFSLNRDGCEIQDVTELMEGERYKAVTDEKCRIEVIVLEIIGNGVFIGLGEDCIIRPYYLIKIQPQASKRKRNSYA